MRLQEEFNPVKSPKTFAYVLENDTIDINGYICCFIE